MQIGRYDLPYPSLFLGIYTYKNLTRLGILDIFVGSSMIYLNNSVSNYVNIGHVARNFRAIGPIPDGPAATPFDRPFIKSIMVYSFGALNSGLPTGIYETVGTSSVLWTK